MESSSQIAEGVDLQMEAPRPSMRQLLEEKLAEREDATEDWRVRHDRLLSELRDLRSTSATGTDRPSSLEPGTGGLSSAESPQNLTGDPPPSFFEDGCSTAPVIEQDKEAGSGGTGVAEAPEVNDLRAQLQEALQAVQARNDDIYKLQLELHQQHQETLGTVDQVQDLRAELQELHRSAGQVSVGLSVCSEAYSPSQGVRSLEGDDSLQVSRRILDTPPTTTSCVLAAPPPRAQPEKGPQVSPKRSATPRRSDGLPMSPRQSARGEPLRRAGTPSKEPVRTSGSATSRLPSPTDSKPPRTRSASMDRGPGRADMHLEAFMAHSRRKSSGNLTSPRLRAGTGSSISVPDSSGRRGPGCPPPRTSLPGTANPRRSQSPSSSRNNSLGRRLSADRPRPTAPGVPSPFSRCGSKASQVGAPIDMPRRSVLRRLEGSSASRGPSASPSRSLSCDKKSNRSPSRLSSVAFLGSSVQVSANGCSIVSSVRSDASVLTRRVHSMSLLPSQSVMRSSASQQNLSVVTSPVGSQTGQAFQAVTSSVASQTGHAFQAGASPVGSQTDQGFQAVASPIGSQTGHSPQLQYLRQVPVYQPAHAAVATPRLNPLQQIVYQQQQQQMQQQRPLQQQPVPSHHQQPPTPSTAPRLVISQSISAQGR